MELMEFLYRVMEEMADAGVSINGAGVLKMLSDKIYAISGEQVCRRI